MAYGVMVKKAQWNQPIADTDGDGVKDDIKAQMAQTHGKVDTDLE
jgi:hypothetical protein